MDRSQVNIRVPAPELEMWREVAEAEGVTLSGWVRTATNVAIASQAMATVVELDGRAAAQEPDAILAETTACKHPSGARQPKGDR